MVSSGKEEERYEDGGMEESGSSRERWMRASVDEGERMRGKREVDQEEKGENNKGERGAGRGRSRRGRGLVSKSCKEQQRREIIHSDLIY